MQSGIRSLGYLGLDVSNVEAWDNLLQKVFALQLREERVGGAWQYKMDRHRSRLSLHPGDADGIAYAGWELESKAALAAHVDSLKAASIEVSPLSEQECADRAVASGVVFQDPVLGLRTELFHGAIVECRKFQPPRAINGYVTGEQGMGHFVMMTSRLQEAVDFYANVLGFSMSDTMDFGPPAQQSKLVFMHCNLRHHSLALMTPPPGAPDGELNHIALTMRDFDDVGYAYDIVREEGIPVLMTLGKHSNDLATSFYVANPSQSAIEMSWGGIEIGEDWVVRHYDDTKIWGHAMYMPPRPLD